ncbi:porwaprin-a-like [Penaeus japonicus]|uniref:porwaprin-a-like n=1 Tax=Penaeus japonicus TaxID=27405 RepID=UPI001C716AE9|nr:porwaprin-a-like [Penaeus japonicus]
MMSLRQVILPLLVCLTLAPLPGLSGKDHLKKAGKCPQQKYNPKPCIDQCKHDYDCEGYMKCCKHGCSRTCESPEPKPGKCPKDTGAITICVVLCNNDYDCDGVQKCCSNGCKVDCANPEF